MSRLYVTTPIYYVNALPHLGTFYTTVVADALARYHRARYGRENVFFLTGLDEHGQKIERIARERGIDPQDYTDDIAAEFQQTWNRVGISNDAFVRTSRGAVSRDCTFIASHRESVKEMWRRIAASGDIYADEYEGLYCVGCEDWKTDAEVELKDGRPCCLIHGTPVEKVKEKNYFFRLSKYAPRLLEWYASGPVVRPESRLNEVRSFVAGGLKDISISRTTVKWGIPVPNDPEHTVYVWIDALTNYLTALGGPADVASGAGNGAFWKDAHHLIAKDILRFHAVYWPALLWSAGLPAPKQVFCHGYLTVKGQKISKSIPATKVDPNAIAGGFAEIMGNDVLAPDPLRYFVLREYALGGDGDFTYESLFQRYQSDLGNDLGNLLNRTLSMAHKYLGADVAASDTTEEPGALELVRAAEAAWESFNPAGALEATWRLIRSYNQKIDEEKPWVLQKSGQDERLRRVLSNCLEALRWAALMVAPAMPRASAEMLRQLGRAADEGSWPAKWGWPGGIIAEPKPVFPRVDPEKQSAFIDRWAGVQPATIAAAATTASASSVGASARAPSTGPAASAPAAAPSSAGTPAEIAIEDFAKIDLRAAKVLSAERVPKADKLLKLTLDLGTEQRTVVSGIAPAYAPEQMVGRTVIYLSNLAPRKIRGVLSQGMILAAGDADVLGLSALDREVPPGTVIR